MIHESRVWSEVAWWMSVYAPLKLKLYAIAPLSKAYYKNLDP